LKPLVSILVPAYNAQDWIVETLQSAIAQTWPRKEIIVVDDGSKDKTAAVANQFASSGVTVVSTENRGVSAAENLAFELSKGDYIQYLDADDILLPDKIERQFAALKEGDSKKVLLSSQWAPFHFRTRHARFIENSLCQDLSPVEWLLRKMGENLHMQTSTWLVSREMIEAAGPWENQLAMDHDGEFFCRVLAASEGTRFVPGTGVYYRMTGPNSVSSLGKSNKKRDSLLVSMKVHIRCLRSLEDSERVREACLRYLQTWYPSFYPERPDIVKELQNLAAELGAQIEAPPLRRQYAWIQPLLGWKVAALAQQRLPGIKATWIRRYDRTLYRLEVARAEGRRVAKA
jgi:glycosyltransferase involved in cell wall biosynthesis